MQREESDTSLVSSATRESQRAQTTGLSRLKPNLGWLAAVSLLCFFCLNAELRAEEKQDALLKGFLVPPESAKPRVWWHWMNGNVTQEGIKLDLEWMHRIGLGGLQNFDAGYATPQVVEH